MPGLDLRERRNLLVYCWVTIAGTVGWWVALQLSPLVRDRTLGEFGREPFHWLLLPWDFLIGVALPLAMLAKVRQGKPGFRWLMLAHFLGQGGGFLVSLILAVRDPGSFLGLVFMLAGVGCAMPFTAWSFDAPVLWGPFHFRPSPSKPAADSWQRTLRQIVVAWTFFLGLVPAAVASLELAMGWQAWARSPGGVIAGVLIFLLGSALGIWSARTMVAVGKGTPLPAECATELVMSGPYAYVRNPMAVSAIVQALGVGVAWASPLTLVYALLAGVWWEMLGRAEEERFLAETFGDPYVAYRDRLRCWVPKFGRPKIRLP